MRKSGSLVLIGPVLIGLLFSACSSVHVENPLKRDSPAPSPSPKPPSVKITSPLTGDKIQGNTVEVGIDAHGIDVLAANGDTSGGTGHYALFIDASPPPAGVALGTSDSLVETADNPVLLPGLSLGTHKILVVLADGAGKRLGETEDEISVQLLGPSVQITATTQINGQIKAGRSFNLIIKSTGLTVVASPKGQQPDSGHFHVLIDLGIPEFAKAIPASASIIHTTASVVPIKGLAPGKHTILVVVGDGGHVPFRPLVMDRLTIEVT